MIKLTPRDFCEQSTNLIPDGQTKEFRFSPTFMQKSETNKEIGVEIGDKRPGPVLQTQESYVVHFSPGTPSDFREEQV